MHTYDWHPHIHSPHMRTHDLHIYQVTCADTSIFSLALVVHIHAKSHNTHTHSPLHARIHSCTECTGQCMLICIYMVAGDPWALRRENGDPEGKEPMW